MTERTVGFMLGRIDCNDGVASHCETLMRELKKIGWNVVLITGPVTYDESCKHRHMMLLSLSKSWVVIDDMRPSLPKLKQINLIGATIKKHNITVLHAHGFSMLVFTKVLKFFFDLPCVTTFHPSTHIGDLSSINKKIFSFKTTRFQKLYLRLFLPEGFIAISSDVEKFLISDLKFNSERVFKVFNGIDTDYYRIPNALERQNSRSELSINDEDFICTLVGRLSWNKGHDVIIDAAAKVKEKFPEIDLKCVFVGSGDQKNEIENYAKSKSENFPDLFRFLGHVKDLRKVYWASDTFVLPSRLEGFGLVIAEAMSCGVVPIRTPGGGASDQIINDRTGFIFPFGDSKSLSEVLVKLVDRDVRERMGSQAAAYASSVFSSQAMADKTAYVYRHIS